MVRVQKAFPDARLDLSEPASPGAVGFLDIVYNSNALVVQWSKKGQFGVSSPDGHGYGEKPDEIFCIVDDAAARITDLLRSGRKTEPPPAVTLRELRAERKLAQIELAARLGVSQPAVSRLEHHVSRMMVASLLAVIRAMGGNLVIQASFPDGIVRQISIEDEEIILRPEPDAVALEG